MIFLSFDDWVRLQLGQVMNLLQPSINEDGLQTNLQVSQIWICLEFCLKLLVTLNVAVSVWVFNVADQGMLLAHLNIIVCELILIMLVLGALDFVFVGILGVLVEVGLPLAVDADLEYLAGVTVGTAGRDSILDGLE